MRNSKELRELLETNIKPLANKIEKIDGIIYIFLLFSTREDINIVVFKLSTDNLYVSKVTELDSISDETVKKVYKDLDYVSSDSLSITDLFVATYLLSSFEHALKQQNSSDTLVSTLAIPAVEELLKTLISDKALSIEGMQELQVLAEEQEQEDKELKKMLEKFGIGIEDV